MSEHNQNHEPGEIKVQPDILPMGKLFVSVGAIVAIVLVALIGVWQYFLGETERLQREAAQPNATLVQLRAAGELQLSQCSVDAKAGTHRIPIRDAMQLLVANPKLLDPENGTK